MLDLYEFDEGPLKPIDEILFEGKEVEQKGANKSKAKCVIVEKIKKFYYLHIYEKINKFGNDEEYKETLTNEIASLEDKIEEVSTKGIDKLDEYDKTSAPKFMSDFVTNNTENKIEKMSAKIDKYEEKLEKISQKETEEPLENEVIASELAQAASEVGKNVEAIKQAENEPLEETKTEEVVNSTPVEVEAPQNEQNNNINNEMAAIENQAHAEIKNIISNVIDKTREVDKKYYEGLISTFKIAARDNLTKAVVQKNQVVQEKNQIANERDQYKSHYEQTTQVVEEQRQQLAAKDTVISDLNNTIDLKDKELSVKDKANEELSSKLEKLEEENKNFRTAIAALATTGIGKETEEVEMTKTK